MARGRARAPFRDGKAATAFDLNETDGNKAMQALAVDTE
jgi:hypothetical protein